MTAVSGLMSWFGIAVTYIRFYAGLKAQGIDRSTLPYYSHLQPYAGWYAVFSTIIICFVCHFFQIIFTSTFDDMQSSAAGTSS